MSATPDTVIKKLQKGAVEREASINRKLKATLDSMKARGASAAEQTDAAETAAREITAAQADAMARVSAVEEAVDSAKAAPEYLKLGEAARSDELLKVAEEAGGTKVFTAARGLQFVSALMTAYYLYHVVTQLDRTKDSGERAVIEDIYYWKAISTNVYLIPGVGEAAFFLDFLDTVSSARSGPGPVVHADAESVLRTLWEAIEDLVARPSGLTRGAETMIEISAKLQIPPIVWVKPVYVKFVGTGRWGDSELFQYAVAQAKGPVSADTTSKLRVHVQDMMQRQAALIYYVKERSALKGKLDPIELVQYEVDLHQRFTGSGRSSYLSWTEELLSGSSENPAGEAGKKPL
jgi:hypothetical protein